MRHLIRPLFARHEPPATSFLASLKSGSGGFVGMAAVGGLATVTDLPFLIAPLGATAVLLFGQPASPLAQPANVVGGYAVAAAIAAGIMLLLPPTIWAAAIGVGVAIAAMLVLRLTHPPAGAVPILAASASLEPAMLALVVVLGSAGLVAIAALHHWLPPRHPYPRR